VALTTEWETRRYKTSAAWRVTTIALAIRNASRPARVRITDGNESADRLAHARRSPRMIVRLGSANVKGAFDVRPGSDQRTRRWWTWCARFATGNNRSGPRRSGGPAHQGSCAPANRCHGPAWCFRGRCEGHRGCACFARPKGSQQYSALKSTFRLLATTFDSCRASVTRLPLPLEHPV
jgi:hypothetical protein